MNTVSRALAEGLSHSDREYVELPNEKRAKRIRTPPVIWRSVLRVVSCLWPRQFSLFLFLKLHSVADIWKSFLIAPYLTSTYYLNMSDLDADLYGGKHL